MALFKNMSITNAGAELYAKAQAGQEIHFTKMQVGSGQIGTQNPATLVALISPKLDVPIISIAANSELKSATIIGNVSNTGVTEAIYICELGLWANDPDNGEILYGYVSAGTYGDYYAPESQGPYSWQYDIAAAIGNAANVTAELSQLQWDYGVMNSNTSFLVISGGNQKEINKSIDAQLYFLTQDRIYYCGTATGTNAYITANTKITAYSAGQTFKIKVTNANTGASTLNINGLGTKALVKDVNVALVTGDILSGQIITATYDGTNFQIVPDFSIALGSKIEKNDFVSKNSYAVTTGTSTAYAITLSPVPTAYTDGMTVTIVPNVDCGATPTLNINSLGALTIVNQDGSAISAGDIKANMPLGLVRVGSNFFIRSAGGLPKNFPKWLTKSDRIDFWMQCKKQLGDIGRTYYPYRYNRTLVSVGDYVYSIGGTYCESSSVYSINTTNVFRYDTINDTWIEIIGTPVATSSCKVSSFKDRYIYALIPNGTYEFLYVYDSVLNTWTTRAHFPGTNNNTWQLIEYDGYIYAIGYNYDISSTSIYKYDDMLDTWTLLKSISAMDSPDLTLGVYNNNMYIIGKNRDNTSFCRIIYNAITNTIISDFGGTGLSLNSYTGYDFIGASVKSGMYIFPYSIRNSAYFYNYEKNSWIKVNNPPTQIESLCSCKENLYLINQFGFDNLNSKPYDGQFLCYIP